MSGGLLKVAGVLGVEALATLAPRSIEGQARPAVLTAGELVRVFPQTGRPIVGVAEAVSETALVITDSEGVQHNVSGAQVQSVEVSSGTVRTHHGGTGALVGFGVGAIVGAGLISQLCSGSTDCTGSDTVGFLALTGVVGAVPGLLVGFSIGGSRERWERVGWPGRGGRLLPGPSSNTLTLGFQVFLGR